MTDRLTEILKTKYGYTDFRPAQREIIEKLLSGRDVLAVMPTGAGKSICYQIPAILSEGVTLVISPLISLMKDQVSALNQNGIRAAYLNSSLTSKQYLLALDNAKKGIYKIIYVAPERLVTEGFLSFARAVKIPLVAVDEAHCVSEWGHDFRKSYTHIADFVKSLPERPTVAAFTATATERVKDDIRSLLALSSPFEITTGFDRPNLYFGVEEPGDRLSYIRDYLTKNSGKSGIIYAMTRKNVEKIYVKLSSEGFPVTFYHAGLDDEQRAFNQEEFIRDRKPVMIATNAFGMGIDKPDVEYILHYNLPLSLEAYYQEAGRAGRDGSDAECILLYAPADIRTAKFLIGKSAEDDPELTKEEKADAKRRNEEKLRRMVAYATATGCLRRFILNYFGETPKSDACGNCSSCRNEYETVDVTAIVRAISDAVEDTGERFGAAFIADFLHGDDDDRMLRGGWNEVEGFASLQKVNKSLIRDVISYLINGGFLIRSEGDYPTLSADPRLVSLCHGGRTLTMRFKKTAAGSAGKKKTADIRFPESIDRELYEALRAFRRKKADILGVPAYVIFSDATLQEIARKKPTNIFELMNVRGIGAEKAKRYGKEVIALITGSEKSY